MLVLSRIVSQDIIIDVPPSHETQRIVVKICDIVSHGKTVTAKVRLGFHADKCISIQRAEIQERIDSEQKAE